MVEAATGEEAVRRAAEGAFALAILDIRMPDLTGIEVARRLRGRCPALMLTAYADRELVARAVEEGAVGYLVKPVDIPSLVAAVETAIARGGDLQRLSRSEERLAEALRRRGKLSLAVGVVMERHALDEAAAFERLRRYARSHNLAIHEVAERVVRATEAVNAFGNDAPPASG
ncbi:MAG: response regulator [Nitrospirae bacterium]|nr:MAG: response regulator [Nitrospirota bacterium]